MYCIVRIIFLLKIGDYLSLTYAITAQSMGQILDRFRKGINDSYNKCGPGFILCRSKDCSLKALVKLSMEKR